jgi:hypothetical protein
MNEPDSEEWVSDRYRQLYVSCSRDFGDLRKEFDHIEQKNAAFLDFCREIVFEADACKSDGLAWNLLGGFAVKARSFLKEDGK